MYTIHDTFNDHPISRHRSLDASVRAQAAFSRAVKRKNGQSSYIPTVIIDPDGERVSGDDIADAQYRNGL